MSNNQYGLPLAAPSKQTILPVVMPDNSVQGFFAITETTFQGTETSFTVAPGQVVPITTVTLPPKPKTNILDEQRVEQYMAVQWPLAQKGLKPWLGYGSLVPVVDNNRLGFYSWWSMPTPMWIHNWSNGTYINAMVRGLDPTIQAGTSPTPPAPTNGTLEWEASAEYASFQEDCAFIDFNWIELFKLQFPTDPSQTGNNAIPLELSVVSNPPGGALKAVLVTGVAGSAGPTIVPGGGVVFNTVRLLRLHDVTAGTYTFTFSVSYSINGQTLSAPATLTLTVV